MGKLVKKAKFAVEYAYLSILSLLFGAIILNICGGSSLHQAAVSLTAQEAQAATLGLPKPTELVSTSKDYSHPVLKGIKIDPKNPFRLKFIIDTCSQDKVSEEELGQLVKYFLAALTIPEDELWVNLDGTKGGQADLSGADLRNADLTGADLRWAYLNGTYVRNADLAGADLRNASLTGAYLR